jgi:hypothetical protein
VTPSTSTTTTPSPSPASQIFLPSVSN